MKKLFTLLLILTFYWTSGVSQEYINENFDTGIPDTWPTDSEQDAFPWFWNDGTGFQNLDGTGYARVDADAAGDGNHLIENLESPLFDASAGNIVIVQFNTYYNDYIGLDTGSVQVWDGTQWNTVWQMGDEFGAWGNSEAVTLIITDHVNPSGDTKIRFHYDDGNSWAFNWAIDDVIISSVDCLEPLQLTVDQLGAISTLISWSSGSGTSNLAYGPTGFDINDIVASGGTLIAPATTPYTISGLDPETTYDFYVQDDCGADGMSGWSGPNTFTTTVGCPTPVFNSFTNATTGSIDITFTQGFGDVYIVYGEEGFLLGSAGDTSGLALSTFTLSGLTPLTFYDIYLFMDCEGDGLGFSESVGPFTFNTLVDGPGTNCGDPIILNNNLPYNQVGETFCGYGNNTALSTCFPFTQTNEEIIYAYSPETDDETIAISLINLSGNYAFISVLDACPDSAASACIASAQSDFGDTQVLLDGIELTVGTIYYIMISTYSWSPCLTFDISIFVVNCSTPDGLSAVSNLDGTAELSWNSTSGAPNYQLEWGIAGFILGEGTVVNGEYGVEDPPITIDGLTSENNYEFYIVDVCVFGNMSIAGGPFEFSGPPPANNLCEDVISINCGDIVTGNTSAATDTGNPTDFCGTTPGASGVWYSYIGDGNDVTLSLCGSDYDTKINVYTGSCEDLVCHGGNDDDFAQCGAGNNSYLYTTSEVGVTYYVLVNGWNGNTGIYTLEMNCITCPLINGLTVGATDVSASVNWTTSNTGANYVVEYGAVGFVQGSGTALTGIIGTDGPPVGITGLIAGSSYDVYVYEICTSGDTNQTLMTSFTTNLLPPPANDLCDNAYPIECGGSDSGSTVNATEIGNPIGNICGFATLNSNTVWYSFVGNGQLTSVSLCGSDFDTELFIFTGDCDSLECFIVADGNGGNCPSFQASYTQFLSENGVTYYIAVAGWAQFASGNYLISVECNPCGNPINPMASVTDVGAEILWSSYLPMAGYTLAWDTAGSDLWIDGTIVTGSVSDLPLALGNLSAGVTYDVCFYEYCEAMQTNTDTICFSFTTNLLPPPDNDDACNAIALTNGDTLVTTNIYASVQDGEIQPPVTGLQDPNQMGWGFAGLVASTWYTYTPTTDGFVNISTCHPGSYDTQLAIYSVEDCNDFSTYTLVAANDDKIGGCSEATYASEVFGICLLANNTYYIQVDPYSNFLNGADFLISVDFTPLYVDGEVAVPSPHTASLNWNYNTTDGTDIDFLFVFTNMTTSVTDTIEGNTANLPLLLEGLDDQTIYEYYIYSLDNCMTSSGPNSFTTLVDGISELSFANNVNVYPNPVTDKLQIEVNAEILKGTSISIMNMQGQVIYQETVADNTSNFKTEIDVDNYSRGLYILKLEDENASIQKRIIIQ
jgi:hypothetical protein